VGGLGWLRQGGRGAGGFDGFAPVAVTILRGRCAGKRALCPRQILLFLKKKKQKDFTPLSTHWLTAARQDRQKFFASFLQKRRIFLTFLPAADERRVHDCASVHGVCTGARVAAQSWARCSSVFATAPQSARRSFDRRYWSVAQASAIDAPFVVIFKPQGITRNRTFGVVGIQES